MAKQQAGEPNWLQKLIPRQYLIDNPHRVRLTLSADTKKRLDWLMRKIKHWQRLIPRLVMMINKICLATSRSIKSSASSP